MKKILLPTDFSDNSWNAIKYALQLFKDDICTFYLLNTYTPVIHHLEYATTSVYKGLSDTMKEVSEKGLQRIEEKIFKEYNNPKHTFSQIAAFNTLLLEIDELYEGNAVDLIVMGTKGATGAKEVLFGTNAVHVIKNAKCPVLAIPDNFEFEKPHEILFPSDYEVDFSEKHLQPIIDIASSHLARVNVLNVSYGYELSEKQLKNKQKIETLFKGKGASHLFHSVNNQNVQEAIEKFQLKVRVNLLVMINNKHSFFENLFFKQTIKQIGFHLNIPFLVIPSRAK